MIDTEARREVVTIPVGKGPAQVGFTPDGRLAFVHATGNAAVDITSELAPRVMSTICTHSAALEETGTPGIYEPNGPPWGICTGD